MQCVVMQGFNLASAFPMIFCDSVNIEPFDWSISQIRGILILRLVHFAQMVNGLNSGKVSSFSMSQFERLKAKIIVKTTQE